MVFITGASSGIGKACATAFASRGHDIWMVARRLSRLLELEKTLTKQFKVRVLCTELDVSSRKATEKFFGSNQESVRKVKILVNNAGLTKGLDPIQSGNIDDWETTIDTNIKGLLYITRGFLPAFLENRLGHVVNIGSVASRWTYPKGNVYCATKRAVSSLTEGMRLDLMGTGIRVTEISPGLVETEFSLVRFKGDAERAAAVYRHMNCLSPQDVAEAVVWACDRPANVNIQEMVIYPTDQASTNHFYRKSE